MSSNPADRLAFEHLIDQLGRQGFHTGVEHYLRLRVLLNRVGDACSPADLKTLLCPLFATNAEQQESFYRAFDVCYPFLRGGESEPERRPWPLEGTSNTAPTSGVGRRPYVITGLLAAALAVAIAVAVWTQPPDRMAPPVADATPTGNPSPPSPAVAPAPTPTSQSPWVAWYSATRTELAWVAVGGPLLLWLVWELHRFRRRQLVIRRAHGKTPPYSWPVRADFVPEIYEPHELAAVSRVLHRRYHGESERFDVTGTVAASIASLGFPTFRYRRDTRLPEYLFLIDRASYRDHQSHLYEHLATMLRAHGLHVRTWFFEGDPRVCWSQTGDESVYLEHLQRVSQSHRLLLFGTGEQLLDAVTGLLAHWHRIFEGWTERAILTPEPASQWSARELTLATQFAVVPATLEGLTTLAAYFELPQSVGRRPWDGDDASDAPPPAVEIDALRRYLGTDVFQWLCACAIYPELQWGLTLCLGALPAMSGGLVCEEHLAKLLRLEWFRAGSIPDDQRRELIAHLDPRIEREVREAIVNVLENNPAQAGTFAASAHHFQIAYQRLRLAPRDRKARKALRTALRNVPPGEIVSDYAYLDAAESVSRSPLQLVLPRRLRKLFYPAGVSWMGMRSAVRLMLAVAVAAGAFQSLRVVDRRLPDPVPANPPAFQGPTPTTTEAQTTPDKPVERPITAEEHARREIGQLVTSYCAALSTLNPASIRKLFHFDNERELRNLLREYKSLKCSVTAPPDFDRLDASSAGRAQLKFGMKQALEMRSGAALSSLDLTVTMLVSRKDVQSQWLIDRVNVEPMLPAPSSAAAPVTNPGPEDTALAPASTMTVVDRPGESAASRSAREKNARYLLDDGKKAVDERRYAEGIDLLQRAIDLSGRPDFGYSTGEAAAYIERARDAKAAPDARMAREIVDQAKVLAGSDIVVAARMLREAQRLDPEAAGAAELMSALREQLIAQGEAALASARNFDRVQRTGDAIREFNRAIALLELVPGGHKDLAVARQRSAQLAELMVGELLTRYELALEARNIEALKGIWPSLSGSQESAIRREFEGARGIQVDVVDPHFSVSGDSATVTFIRHYVYSPLEGAPLRVDTPATMRLRRTNGGWVIEQIIFGARR